MKKSKLLFALLFTLMFLPFNPAISSQSFQQSKEIQKEKKELTSRQQKAMEEHRKLEEKYNVKRGPRPPVNLDDVSEDAYKKGVLRIKLKPYMHEDLDKRHILAGKSGYVKTGVGPLDEVNKSVGAQKYIRRLDNLYEVKNAGVVKKHKERHKAWGFHLLRDIEINSKTDVIEAVKKFNALDEVEYAEPVYKKKLIEPQKTEGEIEKNNSDKTGKDNPKFTPNDPDYDNQYPFPLINAPEAWEITTGNPDVVVAIVDQGIQYDHPDLEANVWDGIGPDGESTQGNYHGTHVGGTVAAVSNNGEGVAGCAGGDGSSNSGVKLMSCDIFDGSVDVEQAQIYAADNGAMISQNSWGYQNPGDYNQSALDGIDYFNENGGGDALDGGLTIFAAGNDDDNGDWYPAYYGYDDPNTMGAMAVASTDENDIKSGFSNYGEWVDISAPGTDIYSTGDYEGTWDPEYIPDSYTYMSGTSMACPHVSGIASAIVSITQGMLTNEELWQLLIDNVKNIDGDNSGYEGQLGSGRIDFKQAADEGEEIAGGVDSPENFAAEATGETSIGLSWDLNENNEDILLAWTNEGEDFGEPVDGDIYNVGDVLPGGGTIVYTGNNTSYSHTDLTAATIYNYRIYSIAGEDTEDYNAGDYSSPETASTHTDCGTYTLPFNENFSDGVPPMCWLSVDDDGDGEEWFAGGSDYEPVSGELAAVSASWSNEDALTPDNWLITPELEVNSDLVEITYWIKAQDPEWTEETYSIMVSETGNSVPVDFTEIHKETLTSGEAEWTEKKVYIENYSGSTIHIAFRHWESSDQFQIVLDDINIEELDETTPIPASDPSPSNNQTDISTDEELTWTWGANTETYDLWFGKAGNMTKVVEGADAGDEGTQGSYAYNDLEYIAGYEWKVVSYNSDGIENETPVWSFTTTCGIVTSFPYTQNFSDGELPQCWENIDNAGDGQVWMFNNPGDRTINTTTGDNGFAILDSDNYGTGGSQDADLISPTFDFTEMDSINLSFEHYYNDYESEVATLSYSTDNGSTWNEIETWSGADTENAETFSQYISNEVAGETGVKFKWNYTGSYGWYWAIDDIEIDGTMAPTYTVTFIVEDEASNNIENATVSLDNEELNTDANGEATIGLPDGTHDYTVTAEGYGNIAGLVEVDGADVTENVVMAEGWTVTFNVTDEETTDPINDASIEINGSTITTDSNGEATIDLSNGTYSYSLTAEGYLEADGSLEVNSADVTEEVAMTEAPIYEVTLEKLPVDGGNVGGAGEYEVGDTVTVTATPAEGYMFVNWTNSEDAVESEEMEYNFTMPENDVTLTANFKEFIIDEFTWSEGFEEIFPPEYWTNNDWQQSTYGDPHSGEEFAYSNNEGSELITPPIALPDEGLYKFSLWSRAESSSYPQDMDVLISTDGENFDVVEEIRDFTNTEYQQYDYSLNNYSGDTIHVKFNGLSGTGGFSYGILVDDIMIEEIVSHLVTFGVQAGNGTLDATVDGEDINSGEEIEEGSEVNFTATPDADNRVKDWFVDGSAIGSTDETYTISDLQSATDVKVEFEEIPTYTLTLNADPAEGGTVSGSGDYQADEEITLSATANDGYKFVNWTDEADAVVSENAEFDYTTTDEDVTLTANFQEIVTYEVTFGVEAGNGILEASVDGQDINSGDEIEEGSEVNFTATPDADNRVKDWFVDGSAIGSTDETYTISDLQSATDVKVEFEEIPTYILTLNADPAEGGTVSGGGDYEAEEEITLSATPNDGYEFENWTNENNDVVSENAEFSYTTTDENVTLTANFEEIVTYEVIFGVEAGNGILEASVDGQDINSGDEIEEGSEVNFTATPDADNRVKDWFVDGSAIGSTDETYTISDLQSATDVKVEFEEIPTYTLTLNAQPAEGGTVSGGGDYKADEEVTLSATANDDYEFVDWTNEADEVVSENAEFSYTTTDENVTLTAEFNSEATTIHPTLKDNVEIYPNPTKGKLFVKVEKAEGTISIHSLTGNLITEKAINEEEVTIDLSGLANGIYLIEIQVGEERITKKLIKK